MADDDRTGFTEYRLLFTRFLRSPRTIGAVAPSSRALGQAMMAGLHAEPAERIVELGPGTGVFTAAIVKRLNPGARLLALDIDETFVERVRARWPTVIAVCGSAEALEKLTADHDMQPVDHVISGLPFASLPGSVTRAILDAIVTVLRPGGTFTTFQYLHAYPLPAAIQFRRSMRDRMGRPTLGRVVFRNLPPAMTMTWRK